MTEPDNLYESGKRREAVVIAPRDEWAAMKVGRLTKAAI